MWFERGVVKRLLSISNTFLRTAGSFPGDVYSMRHLDVHQHQKSCTSVLVQLDPMSYCLLR